MDTEPLLPVSIGSPTPSPTPSLPFHRWRPSASSSTPPSSALCTLPEDGEISIPVVSSPTTAASSSLKDLLIFGHFPNGIDDQPDASAASPPLPASPVPNSPNPSPFSSAFAAAAAATDVWLSDSSSAQWNTNLHRSRTAPAMATINDVSPSHSQPDTPGRPPIISQAFILLVVYLAFGVSIYIFNRHHFAATETHPVVDALYFCIVTMCTIGYGDITPASSSAKIFSILFVIVGFGFVDILLTGMVSYVLDIQESLLLSAVNNPLKVDAKKKHSNKNSHDQHQRGHDITRTYIIDVKKGRMRIRMKVALALCVVLLCIGIGTGVLRFVERLGWIDSFYLSVMSVTTVGYGDRAFKTLPGRLFASLWLLVSTLAVARAFLYLAEARIDKRHRSIAKLVLCRDMTVSEFLAADINNTGFVT
ncbi:two-pore potassium channel 3-like isoform X2 [Curcuma longa]